MPARRAEAPGPIKVELRGTRALVPQAFDLALNDKSSQIVGEPMLRFARSCLAQTLQVGYLRFRGRYEIKTGPYSQGDQKQILRHAYTSNRQYGHPGPSGKLDVLVQ